MSDIKPSGTTGMEKIFSFLRGHFLECSLPYYACCHIKPEGVIHEIRDAAVNYYGNAKLTDYFEWVRNCQKQLINCTIVQFTWDGGKPQQVIFLPCSKDNKGRMVACFEDRGTWYHILYDEESEKYKFIVYCNILYLTDAAMTRKKLNVQAIIKPTFL